MGDMSDTLEHTRTRETRQTRQTRETHQPHQARQTHRIHQIHRTHQTHRPHPTHRTTQTLAAAEHRAMTMSMPVCVAMSLSPYLGRSVSKLYHTEGGSSRSRSERGVSSSLRLAAPSTVDSRSLIQDPGPPSAVPGPAWVMITAIAFRSSLGLAVGVVGVGGVYSCSWLGIP